MRHLRVGEVANDATPDTRLQRSSADTRVRNGDNPGQPFYPRWSLGSQTNLLRAGRVVDSGSWEGRSQHGRRRESGTTKAEKEFEGCR